MEQCVGRNRSGSILRGLLILKMNGPEGYGSLFRKFRKKRDIFCVEGALACVIQNIARFPDLRVSGTFPKLRWLCVFHEGEAPQQNAVIGFITDLKTFVLQKFRVGQKRLFTCSCQNAQSMLAFLFAVCNAGFKQLGGITVALERTSDPSLSGIFPSRTNLDAMPPVGRLKYASFQK